MSGSGCGQQVPKIHDTTERWVRDLPILGCSTRLLVHRCRVRCPTCGPKLEALDWLEPYARVTRRLAEDVARMCQVMTTQHVAQYWGLSWPTVRAIDHAYLEKTLGPVDFTGVEQLLMDEFAIQKGHRYATVVVDAITRRVLWVCRGRSRMDIRPFFEALEHRFPSSITIRAPTGRGRINSEVAACAVHVEQVASNLGSRNTIHSGSTHALAQCCAGPCGSSGDSAVLRRRPLDLHHLQREIDVAERGESNREPGSGGRRCNGP